MRALETGVLSALQSSEIKQRGMILFDFPSGNYGLWHGGKVLTYNGVDFKPGGQILEFDDDNYSIGLAAEGQQIRLKAVPNSNLTPDVLATIEEEQYTGRPVTVYNAYFTPDGVLIAVQRVRRLYIDQVVHEWTPKKGGHGTAALLIKLESKGLDNQKRGYRMRASADQVRVSAGDTFFDHVAVVGQQEINWGRLPEKPK